MPIRIKGENHGFIKEKAHKNELLCSKMPFFMKNKIKNTWKLFIQ
jgi:hypothetical protein